jgi:serine/threonine protein kinase
VTESATTHPALDRLLAWRIGRLPAAEAADVQQHVAECIGCRNLSHSLQPDVLRTLLNAPGDTPSAATDVPTAIHELGTLPPAPAPADVPGVPPELIDHPRYRILGLLGVGGMGSVFKAEHRMMERLVAIKVINRALTGDEGAIERFRREVRTAARLTHPNIVTAFDAEQVADLHFFVMEFVDGNSLDRWVAKVGPLPAQEACNYIRQAAIGLQYAHERGMVHRDVKPQNLLRTKDGEIKILDFGLARFASERKGKDSLTQTGMVMGTPDYIAPEQANDARTADIRADIYSLGCTLYYLLTGAVPFPEGTTLQKFIAHLEKTPRSIRDWRPELPAELETVLATMMAKKPEERYQQPLDVANALSGFLPGSQLVTPTLLRAVELEEDVPVAQPLPQVVELVEPAERPSRVRRRREWDEEDEHDAPDRKEDTPEEAARARGIRLGRQLAVASIVLGLLGLPVTCASCFIGVPVAMAISLLGLGLGLGSGYLAYKHHDRQYGWALTGVCLNIVAFLLLAGSGLGGVGNSLRRSATNSPGQLAESFS